MALSKSIVDTEANIKRMSVEKKLVVHKGEKLEKKPRKVEISKFLENLPTTFYEVDKEGRYIYLSQSWKELIGLEVEESIGKHFLSFVNEEEKVVLADTVSEIGTKASGSFLFSRNFNGKLMWAKVAYSAIYDDNGERNGFCGSITDVTSLKEAEISAQENNALLLEQQRLINTQIEELQLKNNELQKYITSNLELENFAYIASHDLKAPLRSVMSFSQLLKKNYYETLDDRGKKYLAIITEASENMLQLIDDLLKYTNAATKDLNLIKCDIQKVIEEIIYGLESKLESCPVSFEFESLPTNLTVDKELIYNLFFHLIDNAVKFKCPKKHESNISIEAKEMADSWQFAITDNGQGMPQNFTEKAFGLFKKQNKTDNDKGTGIGLSIAKSIVNLHGGKIWIDSEQGTGTSVYFTISKHLEAKAK